MPADWKKLLEELSNLQGEFIEVAQQIAKPKRNQPGVCGSWSPKQVAAHITGWEKEITRQFELFRDGLEEAIEYDIDEFNKESVQKRDHLSWEETITELQQAHEQFSEKAMSISSRELANNTEYKEWVEVQINHYRHHINQLKKWV